MKTPISIPPNPPEPRWIGSVPTANAMGSETGAVIRSYGRTHSAAPTPTSMKKTPYAVCEPPRNSVSRQPNANSARVASSQQPKPVSFGAGIRRSRAPSGASRPRRRP